MFTLAKREVLSVVPLLRYIMYRAFITQKLKVRRSSIGLFLEPVMLVISTYCITLVWSKLFGKGGGREYTDFFLYVLVSFLIWNLISSNISNLGASLLKRSKQITNTRDPLLLGILIDITNNIISFLLSLPIVLILLVMFSNITLAGILFFIYGLFLILATSVGWGLIIGIGSLFFGDLRTIVSSVMKIGFLLTPIIWQVERLGDYQGYIYFNPFYNYLAICRGGLIDGKVGDLEIIIATIMTIVILILGFVVLSLFSIPLRKKIFSL